MKLSLKIHDERTVQTNSYSSPKTEEYVRTDASLDGSRVLVANALRAIADEIDPQDRSAKPKSTSGGW